MSLPFGFDEVVEPTSCPTGEFDFTVGKTNAYISPNSGNPTVEWNFRVVDPELIADGSRFWPVRTWTAVRGKGAGMFKNILKGLGEDADTFIDELLLIYEGDGTPQSVVDFFNDAILPQFADRPIRLAVSYKPAVRHGEPLLDEEGVQRIDTRVRARRPA